MHKNSPGEASESELESELDELEELELDELLDELELESRRDFFLPEKKYVGYVLEVIQLT